MQTGKERGELRDASLHALLSGRRRGAGRRPAQLERAEVEVRALDEAEDGVRVPEQHLAGVREGNGATPFRPFDQAVPDPPLEDRDLLADRRLGEAEARRGAAEGALAGDRPQCRKVAQLDTGPRTE